jgi:hypothetical protein
MVDENSAVPTESADEVVVTDQDLYDHAMSNEPSSPPTPEAPPAQAESTPAEATGQARDDKGRFAAKDVEAARDQAKAAQAAAPQPQPQAQAPQAPKPQPQPKAEDHRVPLRELLTERAERQKLETQVQQLTEAFNYLRQNGQMPQQGAPQGQPQPPPASNPQQLFEQPDQYLQQNVITPLQSWGAQEMMKIKEGISRDYANDKYGEKVVNDAFEAMKKVRYSPDGNFAYQQIMASGNPYKSLVEWHKKQRAHEAIGADPDAWLKQKQTEWLNDPAAQKAMVELIRRQQTSAPAAQPPNVSLPPSLSSIPAASARVEPLGDLSDASLFAHAMK